MAALPSDREMIVVDRPGYGASEPADCVPDIRVQASALEPLLQAEPGQKILLVGQSYGAAIATLMAAARPRQVTGLVLLSSYLGQSGPTARWLVDLGARVKGVIPRDLRHAVIEVSGQPAQMALMRAALRKARAPIHVIHGDADDFAPVDLARRLAAETKTGRSIRFSAVPGGNHFLTDGPAEALIARLEACLPRRALPLGDLVRGWSSGVAARLHAAPTQSGQSATA
jgi:pimeloyl-ACP methyl ester carboxylesterase